MAQGEQSYPLESEDKNPVDVNRDGAMSTGDEETRAILREMLDVLRELLAIEQMKMQ